MGKWGRVFVSNYVTLETTLLLSSKMGPMLPRVFLDFVEKSGITELLVDDEAQQQAKKIFRGDRFLSLTDAASLVLADTLRIRWLGTFDERSFRNRGKDIVGPGYWETLDDKEKRRLKSAISGGYR
jgi:predicted nucleic acid-binding protein